MKLSRTDLPWSDNQAALRDGKLLTLPTLRGVLVAGRHGDKLRVRACINGKVFVLATLAPYQRAQAARVADMATLFFWDYRSKKVEMGENYFNLSYDSAQSDMANPHPALQCIRDRFASIAKLHKLAPGQYERNRERLQSQLNVQLQRVQELEGRSKIHENRLDGTAHILKALTEGSAALINRCTALLNNQAAQDKQTTDLGMKILVLEKRLEHRDQTIALLVAQVKQCLDAMPHIDRRLNATESKLSAPTPPWPHN